MEELCDAAIRPFPDPSHEIRCEQLKHEIGPHSGIIRNYAFPGSETRLTWYPGDRRTFHGEWPGPCKFFGCILPNNHPGECAD